MCRQWILIGQSFLETIEDKKAFLGEAGTETERAQNCGQFWLAR